MSSPSSFSAECWLATLAVFQVIAGIPSVALALWNPCSLWNFGLCGRDPDAPFAWTPFPASQLMSLSLTYFSSLIVIMLPFAILGFVAVFVAIYLKWKRGIYIFITFSLILFVFAAVPFIHICFVEKKAATKPHRVVRSASFVCDCMVQRRESFAECKALCLQRISSHQYSSAFGLSLADDLSFPDDSAMHVHLLWRHRDQSR